jgi:hypothetical protein
MKYQKPEIVQSGAAISSVKGSMNKGTSVLDNEEFLATSAAYEADE